MSTSRYNETGGLTGPVINNMKSRLKASMVVDNTMTGWPAATFYESWGIGSLNDLGVGTYSFGFHVPFAANDYVVLGSTTSDAAAYCAINVGNVTGRTASATGYVTARVSTGTLTDTFAHFLTCLGDIA